MTDYELSKIIKRMMTKYLTLYLIIFEFIFLKSSLIVELDQGLM